MTLTEMRAMIAESQPFSEVEAIATRLERYRKTAGDHQFKALQPDYVPGTKCWSVEKSQAKANHTNVRISGPIDDWFGTDVREIIKQLDDANPKSIHVYIESPGGFAHDGVAMFVDLKARAEKGATVTTEARGLVASAASAIFMAGTDRIMPAATTLMIHNPWTFMMAAGDLNEIKARMAKLERHLESIQSTYRGIYSEATGVDVAKVSKWMDEETYFDHSKALAEKFATSNSASADNDNQPSEESRALAQQIFNNWRKDKVNA